MKALFILGSKHIELNGRKLGEVNPAVKIFPLAKRGRPLLLGETLDNQVKAYITSVCENGGPVTSTITIAVGRAIVRKYDSKLLMENGGPLSLLTNNKPSQIIAISHELCEQEGPFNNKTKGS